MARLALLLIASAATRAACSPAGKPTEPHPIASTPPITSATSPPEGLARPEVEACRIAGPKANLTIAITAGVEELTATVQGAPVTVVPRGGGPSSVEVKGALAFVGRADGLELFPSAPIVVANGVVELGPMSVLQAISPEGAGLVAESVDVGPGFRLSEVRVPCSALTFVGSGDPSESAHRGVHAPRPRSPSCPEPCVYDETPEVLDFHESPGGGARVRLTGSTIVLELERRGPWTRVATADDVHMDGAQITGWVEHARLKRMSGGVGFSGGRGYLPPPGSGAGVVRVGGPGVVQGTARIDAGTPVFAHAAGGEPWATVGDGRAEFEVAILPGNDRARVLRAPLIVQIPEAWVPRTAVHLRAAEPVP